MRRKSGQISNPGAIANIDRAISYFRNDISTSTYNPISKVTSIRQSYPICLPAYLGTSQHRSEDMCSLLRQEYGEGEEGWINFLNSCSTIKRDDYGILAEIDGYSLTKKIFDSKDNNGETICKAAEYCYQYNTECLESGKFYLGTVEDLKDLLDVIDIIDDTLVKLGKAKITNNRDLWSCCLYAAHTAWYFYGRAGFFSSYGFVAAYSCVPFSLFDIKY